MDKRGNYRVKKLYLLVPADNLKRSIKSNKILLSNFKPFFFSGFYKLATLKSKAHMVTWCCVLSLTQLLLCGWQK